MDVYGLRNLIKSPTCYKSADNPSSIDMFLTNKTPGFQYTTTIEVGLSDFHLMIPTVLKSGFVKKGPRIVTYRDYSKFDPINAAFVFSTLWNTAYMMFKCQETYP